MASSLNLCTFIGNLGRDPEVKQLSSGGRVVNFSLAVSERWKDRSSGERRERTTWVPVVIFNDKLGEIAERYLRKGSKVYVAGAFSVRKWTAQDGSDRYATEIVLNNFDGKIVLLDGRDRSNAGSDQAAPPAGVDDEIPF